MKLLIISAVLAILLVISDLTTARKHCQTYLVLPYRRNRASYRDAERKCRDRGMSLARIESFEEDMFLQSVLKTDRGTRRQEGWFIDGVYRNGRWEYVDGTRMDYTNFPPEVPFTSVSDRVTNYAAIFKDRDSPAVFQWGYLSPRSSNKMGIICESTRCSMGDSFGAGTQ